MNFHEKRDVIVEIEKKLERLPEEKEILLKELQKECEHQVIVSSIFAVSGEESDRHCLCLVCLEQEHPAINSAKVLIRRPIKEVNKEEYCRLLNEGLQSLMTISVPENLLSL